MMKLLQQVKSLFIQERLYFLLTVLATLFVAGYFIDLLFIAAKILLVLLTLLVVLEGFLLFVPKAPPLQLTRELPRRLSNGDESTIQIYLLNQYLFRVDVEIIDEAPWQFQLHALTYKLALEPGQEKSVQYKLKPFARGEYVFGQTRVYASSPIGLLQRRFVFGAKENAVACYPSFLKMRQYELLAVSNQLNDVYVRPVRRPGTHTEFEHIKDYVTGDNYRTINWKATAKRGRLMVNQYQQERAQSIYCVVDMGRLMEMPFDHMSLLDYSINASLIFSNIALQKYDKAGLITFNTRVETFLQADNKRSTLAHLLEALYKQSSRHLESNYAGMAHFVYRKIPHRSLLILFTNFQTPASVQAQMPHFKQLARNHLLLVVLFENTEVSRLIQKEAKSLEDIYVKTIGEKYAHDKKLICQELRQHGILSLLTTPAALTTSVINKYLEIKQSGLL